MRYDGQKDMKVLAQRFWTMAKKKNPRSKAKQTGRKPMTVAKVNEVRDWLVHMNRHLKNAIDLSKQVDGTKLDESDHLFWSLAKYAENVQECILQLDKINRTILPTLDEIPERANSNTGFSWNGMKGMRQRLAHDFRKIDPDILWQTVTSDFPILLSLTSHVIVLEAGSNQEGELEVMFNVGNFRSMPAHDEREGFQPGNSMIALFFDRNHKAQCVRIARVDDGTIRLRTSNDIALTNMNVSLIGQDGTAEPLGRWPSPAV